MMFITNCCCRTAPLRSHLMHLKHRLCVWRRNISGMSEILFGESSSESESVQIAEMSATIGRRRHPSSSAIKIDCSLKTLAAKRLLLYAILHATKHVSSFLKCVIIGPSVIEICSCFFLLKEQITIRST